LAAVPSIGRAASVERPVVRGADATSDLYERYAGQIFGYCLHQLGSREEAEDAVQTTFMNAFRGLQRGIVPELESAWLFKIAHNVCLSRRRSTWRRGRVESPNNFEVLQEVVPARERVADELLRLQDVLEEMPENQRRAILLREWQGLTYREIAEELQLSQAAVETLIFRARRALASGLEDAPDERTGLRKTARHGADAGAVLIALKALLSSGGAKIAATAIAVATGAIAGVIGSHHAAAKQHAHHTRPATHSLSSPRTNRSTSAMPAPRFLAAAPAAQGSAAPDRAKPTPRTLPPVGEPSHSSAPSPAPTAPPAAPPAAVPPELKPTDQPKPLSYDAPAASSPAQSDKNAPQPAEQPPSASQADEHGNANAPGQQDKGNKPDKGNGNGDKGNGNGNK
jgi:RNA polymerase sigma factor (sigma-70 family)